MTTLIDRGAGRTATLDLGIDDAQTCPICESPKYRRYPTGNTAYCPDCYKRTGYGSISTRKDGTAITARRIWDHRPSTCKTCGAPAKRAGAKTCGDPICSALGQRIYEIWYEPCPYNNCGALMLKSHHGRRDRRKYCSYRCTKLASIQRSRGKQKRRRTVNRDLALRVAYRYGYRCEICKHLIDVSLPMGHDRALEIDHIIEWSQNGSNALENLRPLHRRCHRNREYGDEIQTRLI